MGGGQEFTRSLESPWARQSKLWKGLWDRVGADLWDSIVLCRTSRVKQTEA